MVAACRPPGCCSVAVPQTTDEWDDAEYAEYRGPTATADVPDRICTSSAALRDTVPAAESASVPGAQLWPCVVCQQHFFFWLVYKAPLTAETGLSRCWWINVTAMIVWTPRVKSRSRVAAMTIRASQQLFPPFEIRIYCAVPTNQLGRHSRCVHRLLCVCFYPGPSAS